MSTVGNRFRDDPEALRITAVVQRAADTAFMQRVSDAFERRFGAVYSDQVKVAREREGITLRRWSQLSQSTRNAESPREFQAFARTLGVSPRWLATGSGWYAEPPQGWSTFGTHVDEPGIRLEFSKQVDAGLMPLWERPLVEAPA